MHAVLVLWDLSAGSKLTIEELRGYLRDESIARWSGEPGLRQKTWISSPESQRWGAMYLFETRDQAANLVAHIPSGRVVEITGLVPEVHIFEVEAITEGQHSTPDLSGVGLARQR
jgi:hypothetical protein